MSNFVALVIASTCLYCTGHWIGGTVLLALAGVGWLQDLLDPFGIGRLKP